VNGWKDSRPVMWFGGVLLPLALAALVAYNVVRWRVYWPTDDRISRSMYLVYTDAWRVVGAVVLKLGVAGILVAWFLLANLEETEGVAQPLVVASALVAGIGFAVFSVGFFV